MTYRDRFECVMRHQQPDRVPYDLNGTSLTACHPDFLKKLLDYCDIRADSEEEAIEKLLVRYDIDFRRVGALFEPVTDISDYAHMDSGWYVDCWGIRRRWTGIYWDIVESPLKDATLEEIKAFPWPDASAIDRSQLYAQTEKAKQLYEDTDYVICAEHPVYGYFEIGCWMFGFDDFLYRLLGEPEVTQWFFQRYHQYVADVCELYYGHLGNYIHLTTSGDDFGMQNGPFMSPEMFRDSIVPWYKKRIALTKSISDARYFHHSCGSVYRLLDDIIDMGADILNPIQPGAFEMEPERLKTTYGNRMVFWGGIDEQNLLSHATPDDVRKETRRVVDILGNGGGYVMAASHNIQPDVPVENVDAMLRAMNESACGN